MKRTATSTCCYCGVGCGIKAHRDKNGALTVEGDPDHPVNQGKLCSKGRTLHHVAMDKSDRILYPRLRHNRDEAHQRVSMDEALDHVAKEFQSIIQRHGPESVAFYVSGQCLTEEYYIANKLMKGFIGSNNIDTNSRLCMSSAVVGYKKVLGEDSCPVSYADIDECSCFLVTGANPAWCHPILWRRVEARLAADPTATLIVIDPRETDTCAQADLHLQIRPGTDVILNLALAKLLIELGAADQAFIEQHTDGYADYLKQVEATETAEAAEICGIEEANLRLAAQLIADSDTLLTMWTMGLNQSVVGTDKNTSLIALSLLTGRIGKPGCGPFSLTGQPNAMGGREVGGLSNQLAVHLELSNEAHREQVADYWGVRRISPTPGYSATEMMEALAEGQLKAIWIICTNPAISLPNLRVFESAMSAAQLVVVQDISERSDTVAYADVVLPAAGWLEKAGTVTNSERRISRLDPLIPPPGEAEPDVWILCKFARKMGWGRAFTYLSEAEIYDEYAEMTRGTELDVSGVSHERLAKQTIQWPCPASNHKGTPRLFTDGRFFTPNQRAQFVPVSDAELPKADPEFPFILTTGRIRDQWHTRTKTAKVQKLNQQFEQPFAEIHPEDAQSLGVKDQEAITIRSRFGASVFRTHVTDRIRKGVVFVPMHWGRTLNGQMGRANNLTSSRVDPISKEPDFKYTQVSLQVLMSAPKTVVVVGAGAGGLQFVQSYRAKRPNDRVIVFGREPRPFYNRILLPDYINQERDWNKLVTLDEAGIEDLNVEFRKGVTVSSIDRLKREVHFDGGRQIYDKLVLCTGSRPFVPPGIPMEEPGMHTLRTRDDAEAIMKELTPKSKVVIMGGGLLGIEMAAALNVIGMDCTIIEMAPRLMFRQLDECASELLAEVLAERGIPSFCGDQIIEYGTMNPQRHLKTKAGLEFDCDVLIVAIGTRPNIESFASAKLDGARGLTVDGHLLTSDPNVYALGEIAEFEGQLFGITAAAQEQAVVAAEHCAGDPWAVYTGSVLFNILKIHGHPVASAGIPSAPEGEAGYEELTFLDRTRQIYRKCVIHQDRMVGCIFIGDNTHFAEYRDLIQSGLELDERRETLLCEGAVASEPLLGRLVCSCNQVGEGNLLKAIAEGHLDLASLCNATRAGTGCGSCRPELQLLLNRESTATVAAST